MEEFKYLIPLILTSILSLIFLLCSIVKISAGKRKKLPPSPLKLPIIGNLHQVGSLPHRDLHSLARKHGPLMLLHLGSAPALIVSSADSACEIMRTHDLVFASRPAYKAFQKLLYGCKDVASAPYGDHWRRMKSILVLQLLSNKRVQTFRSIREEETALFLKKIQESAGPVNLSEMFKKLNNDGVCRAAFGRKYSETENGKKFLLLLSDLMELLGSIDVGDFIPWLAWIGRLNGFDRKLDRVAKGMDQVLESVFQERSNGAHGKDGDNFLDILLEIYNDKTADASIDRDGIKSLILDVFVGGTDTTSTALEWTMSELLRHPTVMEKLQRQVRGVVGQEEDIADDDLEKMHYLKAVIKEALRCHPPLPLLVPRIATKDVEIKGFSVSAGTVVMINAWAIGRDNASWDEPEKFMPERFLNSSIDLRGSDFELIPFGAGRRGCPGITFSLVSMELVLAKMVHKFDWKLPNGIEPRDLDMSESPGSTVHRAAPLLALATHTK